MDASTNLWTRTPLIYSPRLSEITRASVYLKLENLQPSHSFKYRGISRFIQKARAESGTPIHVVIASSGNAGLAAASVARSMGLKCTVFLPEGAASSTIELLKREEANVMLRGRFYAEALAAAKETVENDEQGVMVPSYDSPVLWEGHSSLVHEMKEQLKEKPDGILCSVGGGGLLGGILEGCKAVDWESVRIGAMETIGSNCFHESLLLNRRATYDGDTNLGPGIRAVRNEEYRVSLAHFTSFSSLASGSLGASEPAAAVLKMALDWPGGVKSSSVEDELSMEALLAFADHHKFLVELACATTLVPAYRPSVLEKILDVKGGGLRGKTIVFVICGGFKIDLELASEYNEVLKAGRNVGGFWSVQCGAEVLKLPK